MAPTDTVELRLRYADTETFVQRFAPNVTRGGVFIASREPRPVAAVVRFTISLASGPPLLSGEGKVTWVRPFDPATPTKPHGMGLQFTAIDETTRPMLDRLLAARASAPAKPAAPGTDPRARVTSALPTGPVAPSAGPPPLAADEASGRDTRPTIDPAAFRDFDEGVEESAIRRARDFARVVGAQAKDDELDDLLKPEPSEEISLEQALGGLPQYLNRRKSGLFRIPDELLRDSGSKPSGSENK